MRNHLISWCASILIAFVPLSAQAQNIGEIPVGWKVLLKLRNDLDRDGRKDQIILLEKDDPQNIKGNADAGEGVTANFNPRRLLVLLNKGKSFQEIFRRDGLIPSASDERAPCIGDPLNSGGISSDRNRLLIHFNWWFSCGSYETSDQIWDFRYEKQRFKLIRYEHAFFSRFDGQSTKHQFDLLNHRKTTTSEKLTGDPSKPLVKRMTFKVNQEFHLDEMVLDCTRPEQGQRSAWCEVLR